jgi:REP element-mobilizing transposase RayT
MPCRLFTFHAYRSWMPDNPRGYVRRRKGICPPDPAKASLYNRDATEAPATFDTAAQQAAIDILTQSQAPQRFTLHAVGSDPSHLHILVSWRDARTPARMQVSIKTSLTRHLNTQLARRKWFSENGSRKPVTDRPHFDHLVQHYLPSHPGLFYKAPNL